MELITVFVCLVIVTFLLLFIKLAVTPSGHDHTAGYAGYTRSSWNDDRDITELGINEIKSCGRFTPSERAAEYRRRGQSPSGVIDGVYNDAYRGNGEYNDAYRDWDADA